MKQSGKLRPLFFVLILISLLLSAAFANGAKPMQDPSGNGGLIFDENPGIALLNESISFNLKDSAYITIANVAVEYEMKNLLEQEQSFDMFFVIPPAGGYEPATLTTVYLNGEDISRQCYYEAMDLPSNWKPAIPTGFIEPFSKESYETHFEGDKGAITGIRGNEMSGIHIPISVKANSTIRLLIQYPCEGGYTNRPQYYNSIYNFMYYLTPAKYWNQEPQVSLNVILPESKEYAFHSSIPMEMLSANSYTAKLDKLPDTEWIFSLVDKKGLIYGTNSSKLHTQITLLISLGLLIIGLLASLRFKSRIYTVLGYILAVAYFYVFKGNLVDGYIGEFLLMIPISFIMMVAIPMMYYKHYKNKVEN